MTSIPTWSDCDLTLVILTSPASISGMRDGQYAVLQAFDPLTAIMSWTQQPLGRHVHGLQCRSTWGWNPVSPRCICCLRHCGDRICQTWLSHQEWKGAGVSSVRCSPLYNLSYVTVMTPSAPMSFVTPSYFIQSGLNLAGPIIPHFTQDGVDMNIYYEMQLHVCFHSFHACLGWLICWSNLIKLDWTWLNLNGFYPHWDWTSWIIWLCCSDLDIHVWNKHPQTWLSTWTLFSQFDWT